MKSCVLVLAFATVAPLCIAQECKVEDHPQLDSPFAYVRAEIRGLNSLREAIEEERKIPAPAAPDDPQRAYKSETRNRIAGGLAKYYDCAARLVSPYKASKNPRVQESVEALLSGLEKNKNLNDQVLHELQEIDKAPNAQAVDPMAMKRLFDLTKVADDARSLIMGAVKMSTFGLVREKVVDENTQPYAFTITAKQHKMLLEDLHALVNKKNRSDAKNYIDGCAEILLTTLNAKLPTAPE